MKAGPGGRIAGGPDKIQSTPAALPECDDPRDQMVDAGGGCLGGMVQRSIIER